MSTKLENNSQVWLLMVPGIYRNFQRWAEIFEGNTQGEVTKSKTFIKNFAMKVKKQTDKVREYIQEQEKEL